MLFFDTRLSGSDAIACASCHNPSLSWGDGRPRGIGDGMKALGRRSPTIIDAAWISIMMWDGRFPNLEKQALGPIGSSAEMNMPIEKMIEKLKAIAGYKPLFDAAFPGEGISPETVGKAIATYERVATVAPPSPFDGWVAGRENAISESAKRGFQLFVGKANCAACHSGWNFTDDSFHDIGLASDDIGRGQQLPNVVIMQHAFKTPGLRDVARRAPYMHDGSVATLAAVIDHYEKGGIKRPSLSPEMKTLSLTAQDKADLIAFLESLNSPVEDVAALPDLPR
jgi:cytochrome c peroxidase